MKFLKLNPPELSLEEAREVAARAFGIHGDITALYSERDQNFRVRTRSGEACVLKIATADEDPADVDMQLKALLHIERIDPSLPVPRVKRTVDGAATTTAPGGHIAFLLSFIPGEIIANVPLSPALLAEHGRVVARLGRALGGFFHPAAGRALLWDIRQLPQLRDCVARLDSAAHRELLGMVVEGFARDVAPRLDALRAQVIHSDANGHNIIVDPAHPERVAGIIDFGDMFHGPLLLDLAAATSDLLFHRNAGLEAIETIVSAYHGITPIEPVEADLLYDAIIARLALTVLIAVFRRTVTPERTDYNVAFEGEAIRLLDEITGAGREAVTERVRRACGLSPVAGRGVESGSKHEPATVEEMIVRRKRVMGASLPLFYDPPLHMIRGEGVWLFDASGRRFLDVYNNVPHVGHCHPHVVEAITRQVQRLNTNTRYLFEHVIDYAERLGSLLPGDLKVCAFVNSGSEANDVAWRMAKAYTGSTGGLMMEFAYHGITDAIDAFSPSERRKGGPRPHMREFLAPDDYRGPYKRGESNLGQRYAAHADEAIASLREAGMGPAAFLVDSTFLTNGVLEAPEDYLRSVFQKVRAAGGLCIADEVQAGFGRMGRFMWGHQMYGVVPDIVTLGKPVGNGHPLGVVITRPDIMEAFLREAGFFSTFGGNNVSCAAGLAVLDVMERERLVENATEVGVHFKAALKRLMGKHALIGDVRGHGLVIGIELVRDRATLEPARDEARRILSLMRDEGVLIGSEGRNGNILKLRPPIVFRQEHADMAVAALDRCLTRV